MQRKGRRWKPGYAHGKASSGGSCCEYLAPGAETRAWCDLGCLCSGVRETGQDWSHRSALEGGNQDQPLPVHAGERHLCLGGWKEHARALQELQTDPSAARFTGGELKDHDGKTERGNLANSQFSFDQS